MLEAEDGPCSLRRRGDRLATNNVAEYSGLIAGLRRAAELGVPRSRSSPTRADGEADAGEYKVKNEALRALSWRPAVFARARLGRVSPVRRAHNELADRLVNERSTRRGVQHPFGAAVEAGDDDAALATLSPD